MEFLQKLDLWILDKVFQPIADWVADMWGKSCFWLAKVLAWLSIVLTALDALSSPPLWWYLASAFFVGFSFLNFIYQMEKKDAKLTAEARVMNSARLFFPFGLLRLFVLAACAFTIVVILVLEFRSGVTMQLMLLIVRAGCWIGAFYFAACTPRPRRLLRAGNPLALATVRT